MTIAWSISKATVINAVGAAASYLLTVLLARDGGATQFGEYSLCLAWAAVMTVIIDCASDAAFSHLATKRNGEIQGAFNTVVTTRICAFVLLAACLGCLGAAGAINLPWQTFLLLLPAFNLGILFEYHNATVGFAATICVEKIVLLLFNAALLAFFPFEDVVYVTYAAVSLLSLLAQAWLYRAFVLRLQFAPSAETVQYFGSYWPLLVIALAQLGYGHLSRLIIEGKQGVVIFASVSLAFQVVALGSIFQTQVDRIFRPRLVRAIGSRDHVSFRQLVRQYLVFGTLPMVAGAVLIFFLAPTLIHVIFGAQYAEAGEVLRTISPLFISISLMRLSDLCLLALDRVRTNLFISVATAVAMLSVMLSLPGSEPLSAFMYVVVIFQFVQAAIGGVYALRALPGRA